MNDSELPLFSNTCGKLFQDKVIFASAVRETEVKADDIKDVQLAMSISAQSLLFLLVPLPLFVMPFFLQPTEGALKVCIAAIGCIMMAMAVYKARKEYKLRLYLKNGMLIEWYVWRGNYTEAHNFVQKVRRRLLRRAV